MMVHNLIRPLDKSSIIFRAKDHNSKWVYGHYLFIQDGIAEGHCIWDNSIGKGIPIDINTLCRFTGIHVKDVPLFEYDVLNRQSYWEFYVKFEKGAFRRVPCYIVQANSWEHWVIDDSKDLSGWEIVGNTIDTPSFIK